MSCGQLPVCCALRTFKINFTSNHLVCRQVPCCRIYFDCVQIWTSFCWEWVAVTYSDRNVPLSRSKERSLRMVFSSFSNFIKIENHLQNDNFKETLSLEQCQTDKAQQWLLFPCHPWASSTGFKIILGQKILIEIVTYSRQLEAERGLWGQTTTSCKLHLVQSTTKDEAGQGNSKLCVETWAKTDLIS